MLKSVDILRALDPLLPSHGIAERQRAGVLLVSSVIDRAGDFLHKTPSRTLKLKEKWRRSCGK
jgi:hypothetical protein